MLSHLHSRYISSCLIGGHFLAPHQVPQKALYFTACIIRLCRIWPQEKPNKNTEMKKATYLRHNILEQHEEVTNGENMHGVALGTNEVSSHLFFPKLINVLTHTTTTVASYYTLQWPSSLVYDKSD